MPYDALVQFMISFVTTLQEDYKPSMLSVVDAIVFVAGFQEVIARLRHMSTRNYELCNVNKASFKIDIAHSVVTCSLITTWAPGIIM